jgi:hypothetical protein
MDNEVEVEVEPTWSEVVDILDDAAWYALSGKQYKKIKAKLQSMTCDCKDCGDPKHARIHQVINRMGMNRGGMYHGYY